MEQYTKLPDYKKLLFNIYRAMGKDGKERAIDKFGEGAENLIHTWEAYHFIGFVHRIFVTDYPDLMDDFGNLLKALKIYTYGRFRKLPSAKGFTPDKAEALFKGVLNIRNKVAGITKKIEEHELLCEFLMFCQLPLIKENGVTKPRVMSIFYGEGLISDDPIKQNDPVLINIAQARLSEEIEKLKILRTNSESATQENHKQTTLTSQLETAQENIDVSPEKIDELLKNSHEIEFDSDRDNNWLDPYIFDQLPLSGREEEIKQLNQFAAHKDAFKIWAIVGPSGAGKTRLALEWASRLGKWKHIVLHKEDRDPTQWKNWHPLKPTIIIIDYMFGFDEVISNLINRFKKLEHEEPYVRLILIDHVFDEPLHEDARWGFSRHGSSFNRNAKLFFKSRALDLRETKDQKKIITAIIRRRAPKEVTASRIEVAHQYLKKMQGAYHPLFAALLGDAMKSGQDFSKWNRRQLIDYYLSGDERLPWEKTDTTELESKTRRWASYFIAVATARGKMNYDDLKNAARNRLSHIDDAQAICQKIIADKNKIYLEAFKPDILGESFFLKLLHYINGSYKYPNEFRQVFMAGNEKTHTKDAIEFIAFIQRLARNLLNDKQDSDEIKALWKALFEFMNPSDFVNSEPLKWAVNAGLVDIVDAMEDQFHEEKVALLNKIKPDVFNNINNNNLLEESLIHSMRYFELAHKHTEESIKLSNEMVGLIDRLKAATNEGETPLMFASYYGLSKVVSALINHFENTGIDNANTHAPYQKNSDAITEGRLKDVGKVRKPFDIEMEINAKDDVGNTALILASRKGHLDVFKLLIDKKADVNVSDHQGHTALMIASSYGQIDMVKLILEKTTEIDVSDKEGSTALIYASLNNHTNVATLLLKAGAKIEAADNKGRNSLILTATNGHIEMVKLLLDKGAKVDAIDNEGHTALIASSANGYLKTVRLLIDRKANIETTDNEGRTAFIWASLRGKTDVVRYLLEKNDINAADNDGYTALIWASLNGYSETVSFLLENGADINATDTQGAASLMFASTRNHFETVKLLLDNKANIDAADDDNRTALMVASLEGHIDTVRLLLDRKANIEIRDIKGCTALMWAILSGHIDIVRLLLEKKADINATDHKGKTALMLSIEKNHTDIVMLLLDKEANIHAIDERGHTALMIASLCGKTDVVRLLLDKKANIEATDKNNTTALLWASSKGHLDTVELLLDRKANIEAVGSVGQTALMWACSENHIQVVKLLLKRHAHIDAVDHNGRTALSIATAKENKEIVQLLLDHGVEN